MGTSDVLSIGLSGTLTAERSLATASHNIANANTKGFSRQRVEVDTRQPQLAGIGALGTGVKVINVKRIHDEFVSQEMRSNASIASGLQTNYDFTSQIDNMLADPNAGLAPTIHSFFNAINNVSNDPSSQSSRQVLIGEANALSERFSYLDSRFESLRKGTNDTLKSHVNDVNNLAKAIADVNWKIVLAKEVTQGDPSDLLDQRERLLHQLSEKVVVRSNEQEDGALNVFIGNGQTLVLGKRSASLSLKANEHDPSQLEVVYRNQGADAIVSKFMKGGSIGGLLDFRENMIAGAQNELGRIAIGISKTFNDQHRKGMTLENKLGGDFFKAIDKSTPLTLPSNTNNGDYELKTTITNTDNLTISDYMLNYNNGMYTLIREKDDEIIGKFNSLPQSIESEGFTVELERGTTIANGDSFKIRPTRAAAREFDVAIERANEIAAAAPVRVRTSVHNMGDMKASLENVADVNLPSFTLAQGVLSPTITVRFLDDNHIELLDDKGKVIQAQQLNEQNKAIPATPGIAGEPGSPATPAIPAIPVSKTTSSLAADGEYNDNTSGSPADEIEKGIFYDPERGINLFPTPTGLETGYSVQLTGKAKAGDTFVIEFNRDGVGNNVNALNLGELQSKPTLDNATSNYSEVYSQLVSRVGSKTHELDVNREAQGILYEQAKAQREAVSGVNLDEEAADLIKYQQAYEANAKVIGAASEMFDTLIGVLRR
ncbi:MAG: flagellar hook-associated protein FlgK [Gammaproteobacteria bacterium]|nr:flagellar hook-associated protein FlgK [Gammaproteobacteria bacterium]